MKGPILLIACGVCGKVLAKTSDIHDTLLNLAKRNRLYYFKFELGYEQLTLDTKAPEMGCFFWVCEKCYEKLKKEFAKYMLNEDEARND